MPEEIGSVLAHVMDWHWDPQTGKEVCYTGVHEV